MRPDRLPIPLQAAVVAFGAAMLGAPTYLLWFILRGLEATSSWAWGVPAVGAAVQFALLRRFVRKASAAGLVRPDASPGLTALITTAATASLWLMPLLPSLTGPRTALDRHAVGLDVAVPALLIWLGACAALALPPRRTPEPPA